VQEKLTSPIQERSHAVESSSACSPRLGCKQSDMQELQVLLDSAENAAKISYYRRIFLIKKVFFVYLKFFRM
jgi:hypothetical protein